VSHTAISSDNAAMAFGQLFFGFLQAVGMGSAAVFVLLLVVGIRTPRRSSTFIRRETSR
jgi:hypothetical protein